MYATERPNNNKRNSDWNWGHKMERVAADALRAKGFNVRPASKHDDINHDIDCWMDDTPVSIKSLKNRTWHTSNSLAFELKVEHKTKGWQPSWFEYGHSNYYVFVIEGDRPGTHYTYVVNKLRLKQYVAEHGWDRTAHLTPRTQAKQRQMGHSHVNSEVGIIKLRTLVREKIAFAL